MPKKEQKFRKTNKQNIYLGRYLKDEYKCVKCEYKNDRNGLLYHTGGKPIIRNGEHIRDYSKIPKCE